MIKRTRDKPRSTSANLSLLVLVILTAGACFGGLAYGFGLLRGLWLEQFRVENPDLDVVVTSGKMIHPDVIVWQFGLTNGANLATIPFEELRTRVLEKIPNIRDIKIERRLPNRVIVDVVEREPVARIGLVKGRVQTNHVTDFDGVVFRFSSDIDALPLIREPSEPYTQPGKKLPPSVLAALRLVQTLSLPELSDLHVLEIATAHPDYLLLTLGDYSRAKIAWDHMLEDSKSSRESLRRQLTRLDKAIASRVSPQTTLWTVTDYGTPGRVYASDSSPLKQ